mmetsp:Transcript_17734/g.52675  ORF Transcript_17734/g.52675 Transcript_17734/m.52675 type:complete len:208 (-) Transcript_17734:264-887(-)
MDQLLPPSTTTLAFDRTVTKPTDGNALSACCTSMFEALIGIDAETWPSSINVNEPDAAPALFNRTSTSWTEEVMAADDTSTVCSARFGSRDGAVHSRMSRDAYDAGTSVPPKSQTASSNAPAALAAAHSVSFQSVVILTEEPPDRGPLDGWTVNALGARAYQSVAELRDGSTPFSNTYTRALTTDASSTSKADRGGALQATVDALRA